MWFINKDTEFAEGYEWEKGGDNHYFYFASGSWSWTQGSVVKNPTSIYMPKHQAEKFKVWLKEHAPNGYLEVDAK